MRRRIPQQLCWVSKSDTDDEDGEASRSEKRRVLAIVESDEQKEGDLEPLSELPLDDRANKDDGERWTDWEAFVAEVEEDCLARPLEHYSIGGESTTDEEGDFDDSSSSGKFLSKRRVL